MAAPSAIPVSAPMFAQVIVVACGLALCEPAAPAGASSERACSGCATPLATDSIRAATVRRARNATRDGAWNAAADMWRDALLLDDRTGTDWLELGDVLLEAERHREAAASFLRAIQVDARLTMRATLRVARAYARMGNDRQAVRWLEQAIRLGERPADLWRDESFRRYRDTPRLKGDLRRQVGRGGVDRPDRVGGAT
jgi:tetratricopeptide (TPR) repeat protein